MLRFPDDVAALFDQKESMSHKTWDIEAAPNKGHRATVKLWPTGRHKDQRYRMLRGPWYNTGNRSVDYYRSQTELQRRLADLEASWEASENAPARPTP